MPTAKILRFESALPRTLARIHPATGRAQKHTDEHPAIDALRELIAENRIYSVGIVHHFINRLLERE